MQQLPPQPAATDPLCSLGLLDCKKNPILIGSSGATGMLDGASSEVPFGACAEHDTVELKPVAVERLLLLDWYGKARRAPKSTISLLGANCDGPVEQHDPRRQLPAPAPLGRRAPAPAPRGRLSRQPARSPTLAPAAADVVSSPGVIAAAVVCWLQQQSALGFN
jgi:hypothetical protein